MTETNAGKGIITISEKERTGSVVVVRDNPWVFGDSCPLLQIKYIISGRTVQATYDDHTKEFWMWFGNPALVRWFKLYYKTRGIWNRKALRIAVFINETEEISPDLK